MKRAMILLLVALPAVSTTVQAQSGGRRDRVPIALHPGALAQMIDELGGQEVRLMRAKVVSMLNPQALLIESAGSLEPAPGFLNRVIVLVQGGTIRLTPRSLVGAIVGVTGVARTVSGMQASREVAWPPELTSDVVRRYQIHAAILTSAVYTSDGVPIVTPHLAELPERGDSQ